MPRALDLMERREFSHVIIFALPMHIMFLKLLTWVNKHLLETSVPAG